MAKFRNWTFTINNFNDEDIAQLQELDCRWVIGSREHVGPGEAGTPHIQGAVSLVNAISLKSMSGRLSRARLVVSNGTPAQNRVYCRKGRQSHEEYVQFHPKGWKNSDTYNHGPNYGEGLDENLIERGDCPSERGDSGSREKARWLDAFAAVSEGRLEDVDPQILCQHLAKVEYAVERVAASKRKVVDLEELDNWWIYGPHHTGKTVEVDTKYPGNYRKDVNTRNWDDYNDEETVYYEDVDKDFARFGGDLKRQAQKQPFPIKQIYKSTKLIRPKRICITSNYHPREIWTDLKMLDPILGRFNIQENNFVFPRSKAVPPS